MARCHKLIVIPAVLLIMQIANYSITENTVISLNMPALSDAEGHAEGISLSASTSRAPTIDGVTGQDEWADAACIQTFGKICVMNDYRNLYIAFTVPAKSLEGTIFEIWFDNNHNGVKDLIFNQTGIVESEDILSTSWGASKFDFHLDSRDSNSFGWTFDSNRKPRAPNETGTIDGRGAWTSDGRPDFYCCNYYEFSHPLCSLDRQHDFCLSEGDTVGFNLSFTIIPYSVTTWPLGFFDPRTHYTGYGDIVIAHSLPPEDSIPPEVKIRIDLKPNDDTSILKCKVKEGKIRVGIFTDNGFDARSVDVSTIQLDGIPATNYKLKDLDSDGDLDGVAGFKKRDLCKLFKFFPEEKSIRVTLAGLTLDGRQHFVGNDTIRLRGLLP